MIVNIKRVERWPDYLPATPEQGRSSRQYADSLVLEVNVPRDVAARWQHVVSEYEKAQLEMERLWCEAAGEEPRRSP
jgi:hypothetical protein